MPQKPLSLPAWECGLKYFRAFEMITLYEVTPCVGVWIEIAFASICFMGVS